jgi:hypothetical protein
VPRVFDPSFTTKQVKEARDDAGYARRRQRQGWSLGNIVDLIEVIEAAGPDMGELLVG